MVLLQKALASQLSLLVAHSSISKKKKPNLSKSLITWVFQDGGVGGGGGGDSHMKLTGLFTTPPPLPLLGVTINGLVTRVLEPIRTTFAFSFGVHIQLNGIFGNVIETAHLCRIQTLLL